MFSFLLAPCATCCVLNCLSIFVEANINNYTIQGQGQGSRSKVKVILLPVITKAFFSSCSMWLTCSVSALSYCYSIVVNANNNNYSISGSRSRVKGQGHLITCNNKCFLLFLLHVTNLLSFCCFILSLHRGRRVSFR